MHKKHLKTFAFLPILSLALLAIACTSENDESATTDVSQPTSETAFIEAAEAASSEAVGMSSSSDPDHLTTNDEDTRAFTTIADSENVFTLTLDEPVNTTASPSSAAGTLTSSDGTSMDVTVKTEADGGMTLILDGPDSDVPFQEASKFFVTWTDDQSAEAMVAHDLTSGIESLALEIEEIAAAEREAWELRLTDIWDESISGVVLIELENLGFFGSGTGAGWFWDNQGHIVTNHHVVRPTTNFVTPPTIIVETFDGDQFEAEFVGGDPISDIAVIKIDAQASTIHPLLIGDSADLKPGMTAVALGHPFGVDQAFSMTHGIISGLSRSIQSQAGSIPIPAVIQTDADMNPGNSGGPLLNSAGQVIGVNTQIRSLSNTNSGVGFATPINLVRRVVNNIIDHGTHEYPLIGISSWVITPSWIERLDLDEDQKGLLVTAVSPDGPADNAGIRSDTGTSAPKGDGDIIVSIDNVRIEDLYDLRSYIMLNTSPGDTIVIEILRDAKTIPITLTLGSWGDQFN